MMKKYKLYLFDFDGTLFDTESALTFIFQESFAKMGVNIVKEEVMDISRKPLPETYLSRIGDLRDYQKFIDYVHELVHSDRSIEETKCFEETKEFITYLKDKNINCGVVTSNHTKHVKRILEHNNLSPDTFMVYVGNDVTKATKPDPTPILLAIEMANLKIKKSEIVYVGDGLNDVKAANNAGIDAILIDRKDEFKKEECKKIHSLTELFK